MSFLANLLTAENQSYWATCLEKEIKIPRVRVQYGENVLVAQGKIVFRKHMFEHFRRGCEYAETVVENARIYNAAMTRTFECNTDGTSLDGYVIDFFEGGWRY